MDSENLSYFNEFRWQFHKSEEAKQMWNILKFLSKFNRVKGIECKQICFLISVYLAWIKNLLEISQRSKASASNRNQHFYGFRMTAYIFSVELQVENFVFWNTIQEIQD